MPKKAKETSSSWSSTWSDYGGGYGNLLTSRDYQPKSPMIGAGSVFKSLKPNEYFPKENFQLNMSLFLTVPYLFAGISVRAHYSLGLPFRFVDNDSDSTVEEKYLDRRAKFLNFKSLLFKTSVHMDVYGNAFWYLRRTDSGQIYDITIIQPERMSVALDELGDVESYNISYPNYENRGMAQKLYTIPKEDIIQFKLNDLGESPWGFSLLQPVMPLVESRMELNKILPVLFKAYAKPYRHFKFTPPEDQDMTPDDVQGVINDMITVLNEEIEPDSDIVTADGWEVGAVSTTVAGNPSVILDDIDEQVFAALDIPKYFFKPSGTTDLNISKADEWFRTNMKFKIDYVSDVLMRRFVIPELDIMFPDSDDLPEIEFEDQYTVDQSVQQTLSLYKDGLITQEEARKGIGFDPLPISEVDDMAKEKEVARAFRWAMNGAPELAEKWQDREMSDSELLRRVKVKQKI